MGIKGFLGSEEERSAACLIERAGELIVSRGLAPADFISRLFGHAAPEDLIVYDPVDLAVLAEQAWLFLDTRKAGAPKIRITTPAGPESGERLKMVSVIEIINDDMPFLVDSVMAELVEHHRLPLRLVVHPIFPIEREAGGRLKQLLPEESAGPARESFIHVHLERIDDDVQRAEIVQALEAVLADVRIAVTDWKPMLGSVDSIIAAIKSGPSPLPAAEVAEAVEFLEWLRADNFTFLGTRDYALAPDGSLQPRETTGLGVLRAHDVRELTRGRDDRMAAEIGAFFKEPKALIVTKSSLRSRVHRRAIMDFIGVKRFDAQGRPAGEFRIVGLFTSTAYTRSTRSIPYLRRKVDAIVARAGFNPAGHSGKALVNLLETYPRDELFQIEEDELYRFAQAILLLDEHPRVRVLARRDRFDRFISALVYIPRERAGSNVVNSIGEVLAGLYKGRVDAFSLFFPEGSLVRIHFVIGLSHAVVAEPDRATLEYAVGAVVRTWTDALSEQLALAVGPIRVKELFARYRRAFSAGYRARYSPAEAVKDIHTIEGLSPERPLAVELCSDPDAPASTARLKVWSYNRPIPLSERVPVLENMGFRVVEERTSEVAPQSTDKLRIWLHDMTLERADGAPIAVAERKSAVEACFIVVMRGVAEDDGYNALVLLGGLWWRDVVLIRAISRYLRQIRVPYSQDYMWATLRKHAAIVAEIVALFDMRFDPRLGISMEQRAEHETAIVRRIGEALNSVESLDEDRILRHFVNAVTSAVRTNFYQIDRNGMAKSVIAIKFDSGRIDDLPLPRPLYEIFVYSPRVEGVHLRFGKVARGGIRWSDRPQDFRTEILGLVKAQQVKNAVIVPVGAKGGFVPKRIPAVASREVVAAEGVAVYQLFISSLLDVTDNLSMDGVTPPENVVRHDGDDAYLVVAADKGTATFSDTANTISLERGFWLGDAFASGGSAGYDHKKMGITARGAWEAVKRHFCEMDIDITRTPFTVAGIGDMSGDVFGNGMLRENTIRLVAAFDHRDIFIDPDPEPAKSFAERQRLFNLPRSSWKDYDAKLISKGGGVFSRSAKEIPLSPEMRSALDLAGERVTPAEVMRAILKMPVDLLWFGGIGTYVRASDEANEAVGDRTNDPIRVTGADLRCKVIGEGANLGMTQRGRVEASFRGVRLNTDAIDNSAGVNTSDVEVNIKIALSLPMQSGALSMPSRNALLTEMTDEVAHLVLRNNYLQTLALSLAERRGIEDLGFLQRLMQTLEKRGLLDRAVEFLPDDMALIERRRRGQALARPELAVLLAYAKLALFAELLDSEVPDDPYLARELGRYFPQLLSQRFPEALQQHRLRREIIATQLVNSMINRGGPSLVVRMADETGASPETIALAFAVVRDSYGMTALNGEIDALDGKISGKLQLDLYASVQDLLLDRLVWFIRNADMARGLESVVTHFCNGVAAVQAALEDALPQGSRSALSAAASELKKAGVPSVLAHHLASLPALAAAPDIVLVADAAKKPVSDVARTYYAARDYFRLDAIAGAARGIAVSDYFDRLALDRARDDLGSAIRRLTAEMVTNGKTGAEAVETWVAARDGEVERIRAGVHEIAGSGLTLSKLSVAASLLGDLATD